MKLRMLAASAAATLVLFSSVAPSMAQYYPYPQPPPRPYYGGPQYGGPQYGGPGYGGGGYYSPYQRPVVVGNICETSRGACQIRATPEGARCKCNIPGFGPKHGVVTAQPGW
jgi:hypothetical protein